MFQPGDEATNHSTGTIHITQLVVGLGRRISGFLLVKLYLLPGGGVFPPGTVFYLHIR
jgi:hypothetical protein